MNLLVSRFAVLALFCALGSASFSSVAAQAAPPAAQPVLQPQVAPVPPKPAPVPNAQIRQPRPAPAPIPPPQLVPPPAPAAAPAAPVVPPPTAAPAAASPEGAAAAPSAPAAPAPQPSPPPAPVVVIPPPAGYPAAGYPPAGYPPAGYPPAGYDPRYGAQPSYPPAQPRLSKGLLITGIAILGSSYGLALLIGLTLMDEEGTCSDCDDVGPPLLVPFVGPFIAADAANHDGEILMLLGLTQLVGAGLLIGGIIKYKNSKKRAQQQGYVVELTGHKTLAIDVSASPKLTGPRLQLSF